MCVVCGQALSFVTDTSLAKFDMYTSLFQDSLLKIHNMHVRENLVEALNQELIFAYQDDRPSVRIHCVNESAQIPGVLNLFISIIMIGSLINLIIY